MPSLPYFRLPLRSDTFTINALCSQAARDAEQQHAGGDGAGSDSAAPRQASASTATTSNPARAAFESNSVEVWTLHYEVVTLMLRLFVLTRMMAGATSGASASGNGDSAAPPGSGGSGGDWSSRKKAEEEATLLKAYLQARMHHHPEGRRLISAA